MKEGLKLLIPDRQTESTLNIAIAYRELYLLWKASFYDSLDFHACLSFFYLGWIG